MVAKNRLKSTAEREFHRRTAAKCFNSAWDYLDKKRKSREDDLMMLNLAHASLYHWGMVGTPRNRAVGEWQLSRVYAELGEPRLAIRYAKACLSAFKKDGLEYLVPTAYEALARAHAVAEDVDVANKFLARARNELDRLTLDAEDRKIFLGQIADTRRLIDRIGVGRRSVSRRYR